MARRSNSTSTAARRADVLRAAAPRFFADARAFRGWLESHASTATELVVGFRKVGSGRPSLTWPQSVDEALCFGWIDGIRKRIDDDAYLIRFTPRKARSVWSAVNIARFHTLRAEGRTMPAGEAAFARRIDERSAIYSYERRDEAALSAEELRRFRRAKTAWAYFGNCPPGYRKTLVYWVASAKRPATRLGRFEALLAACAEGRRMR